MIHEITIHDSDDTESSLSLETSGTDQVCVTALLDGAETVVYLSRIQTATLAAWLTASLLEIKKSE